MSHYIHVAFRWNQPEQPTLSSQKQSQVEAILVAAEDWIRYAPSCWLIKTADSSAVWYDRLRHAMTTSDSVLVCRVDLSDVQGWQPLWVWERLGKAKPQKK